MHVAATCGVNRRLVLIKQSSIKGLGEQPVGYLMVRTTKLKVFKPLPCLVEGFKRSLLEGLQLCPDLRSLSWGIELSQKAIGWFLPGPIYTGRLGFEPGLALSFKLKGKSLIRTASMDKSSAVMVSHLSMKSAI